MVGTYQSPFGQVIFYIDNGSLTDMMFDNQLIKSSASSVVEKISDQLDRYFHNQLRAFDVPIAWHKGTPFQHQVWEAMLKIPYGKTASYSEIAQAIGHPKAFRAVGQACKNNPIGIIVPCHRVIGKDGSMTGYSGKNYVHLKQALLAHEARLSQKGTS